MKALIAMSGGVDSGVAAFLIKKQNIDAEGAIMLLHTDTTNDVKDAESVAKSVGIPFRVYDFREEFVKTVVGDFVRTYEAGKTPNPCIVCNNNLKFGKLLETAVDDGFDKIVTGHYAVVELKDGRYVLKKAVDKSKDQSYVLYGLTQQQLSRVIFPLGEYSKTKIRKIAEENGFINARKGDSQDICFVPDGDYVSVIRDLTNKEYPEGNFVDKKGNILGRHKGIICYTVGQRKGLGLSLNVPMYVLEKNILDNTVTLASNDELFNTELDVERFNYILFDNPKKPFRAKVKIRYNQQESWATLTPTDEDTVHISFDEPQRAISKGQSAVAYIDDYVVGGGIIK